MADRPFGRDRRVSGEGKRIYRRGEGLGTGPAGEGGPDFGGNSGNRSGGGGRSPLFLIIGLIVVLMGGGGGLLGGLLGGQGGSGYSGGNGGAVNGAGQSSATGYDPLSTILGGGSVSSGWALGDGSLSEANTAVAEGARAKRTVLQGEGLDQVTLMVYMCGTDLESRSGMATADLQEMAQATLGSRINLIVYTGGCTAWKNAMVSGAYNQIYRISDGKFQRLVDNAGSGAMTDPETLSAFIRFCGKNFPANRNMLIFWDHGGGSVSGYGYDEKNRGAGSMELAAIRKALADGGVSFDWVGFDACLMATAETALTLDPYSDYMIASEETEPGVGWYYTDWLTALGKDTSMPTVQIGKNIVDDFVSVCASKCPGQKTTLSVVDLAEFGTAVPDKLAAFSQEISGMLSRKEYQTVSDARYGAREFAASSRIDQVDLIHLASNLAGDSSKPLMDSILSAVKYNRTSANMTNAYGISIYFPYQKAEYVDHMVNTYEAIGMDAAYGRCISQFAALETSGQAVAGGSQSASPLPSLLSVLGGMAGADPGTAGFGSPASGQQITGQLAGQLLTTFLANGGADMIAGLGRDNTAFLSDRAMSDADLQDYLAQKHFDQSQLTWTKGSDGRSTMSLSEEQWQLVHDLDLNLFYDDGEGFIDLGLDNAFSFDEKGALIADETRSWVAVNSQPVAYYRLSTENNGEEYTITGRVPVRLNGNPANLILVFDNAHPQGYVAGAAADYTGGETETAAKNLTELSAGDVIDFICDYYSYEGVYQDSYMLGDQLTVPEGGMGALSVSNVDIGEGKARITYRFTDIYNQQYWSPAVIK